MRLSHGRLEEARRNPTLLGAPALQRRASSRGFALSSSQHTESTPGDFELAVRHLENLYSRNFKRPEGLPPLVAQLRAYEANYRALGTIAVDTNVRIALDLTPSDTLIGEVGRIDLDPWRVARSSGC